MQAVILRFCLTADYLCKIKQNCNKVSLLVTVSDGVIHLPLQVHPVMIPLISRHLTLTTMTLKLDWQH